MPWRTMQRDEQRMQFVIRVASGKERLSALCREFGVSRPTGYLWRQRYESSRTLTELAEHSRKPKSSPSRTAAWKERCVTALRRQTGWGAKKLHVLLAEEQIALPVRTIHRILERHDMVSDSAPGPAPNRFERSEPNQLWQMDSKGKYRTEEGNVIRCRFWMITAAMRWVFIRCGSWKESRPIHVWSRPFVTTACRKPC